MQILLKNKWLILAGLMFTALLCYFTLKDKSFFALIPLALLVVYSAIFHTENTLLLVVFLTPISVNLEEFTEGRMGLFMPTEPILFGLMLIVLITHFYRKFLPNDIWKHPITWAIGFYLFWMLVATITSTHVAVSLKFMLVKLWYIIPVFLFGVYVFRKKENITKFFWLYVVGMVLVMLYTLITHAQYSFGEKEGHWVMSPFFKDHTIYGAGVALNLLFVIGLYFVKKQSPLIKLILIGFLIINLIALFFSYTRAAWLSVVAAGMVYLLIRFKVKFKYLAVIGVTLGVLIFASWDQINIAASKNKQEHTTEDFGERLQSATNVTTDASNLERINRWTAAWKMFQERPITGFGPGTYAFEYAPFQNPENLTIISTNFGNMGNAHSEYLGPLAETGFPGTISVLLIVIAIFYTGIRLYHRIPDEERELKLLLLCGLLALVTYFVHGVLNNYLDTDKASIPVWGVCAIIVALEIRFKTSKKDTVARTKAE